MKVCSYTVGLLNPLLDPVQKAPFGGTHKFIHTKKITGTLFILIIGYDPGCSILSCPLVHLVTNPLNEVVK